MSNNMTANAADRAIIYGNEMSPYSIKLRAFLRYKNIPFEWRNRATHEDEFKAHAKLPIIPLLLLPDGTALQDSTPIMDHLETHYPNPPQHPADPELRFLSILLEEFGDEWLNKIMFHFRWYAAVDQQNAAHILARSFAPEAPSDMIDQSAEMVRAHMSGRGHFVGSSAETAPLIETYFHDIMGLLETHLAARPYLFGGTPMAGDFGIAAQIYEMVLDTTAGGHLRARYPQCLSYALRMHDPLPRGAFESWADLAPTLEPLLQNIGAYFLPWSRANRDALAAGDDQFSVTLGDARYVQAPQKYHARSLSVLEEKYAADPHRDVVAPILEKAGIAL